MPSGRDYQSTDLLVRLSNTATQNMLLLKRTSGGAGAAEVHLCLWNFEEFLTRT